MCDTSLPMHHYGQMIAQAAKFVLARYNLSAAANLTEGRKLASLDIFRVLCGRVPLTQNQQTSNQNNMGGLVWHQLYQLLWRRVKPFYSNSGHAIVLICHGAIAHSPCVLVIVDI